MVSAGVRDVLVLTGAVGAYGAGQKRSDDVVLLNVMVSLSGTDRSSVSLYLVARSGDGTTLDEAKQNNRMIKPGGTSHKAMEKTGLASAMTKYSGLFPLIEQEIKTWLALRDTCLRVEEPLHSAKREFLKRRECIAW